jgi:bifunctional DNA-binding transcriptional regulator/antitoxin component of YhaV-PrlF toxin-antitoxin module
MTTKVKAKKKAALTRRGRTSTSKLSSKNQLTVPVDILREAGINEGDLVRFQISDSGAIEIKREEHPMASLIGITSGLYSDFDLRADRDSWEK